MRLLEELCETGVYQEYVPPKAMTVRDWLQELNLNQIFTVLVNGKKADLDLKIGPKDKVVIIPQIAGGQQDKLNLKKFELSLVEGQGVEFDIESNKGNAHGQMPAHMIVSFLNSMLNEKKKTAMQKVFSDILLETFKPVTDFIERYGLNDSARFTKDVLEEAMVLYESYLLSIPVYRMTLWLSQKIQYFGW